MSRGQSILLAVLTLAGCLASPAAPIQPPHDPVFANGALGAFRATDIADLAGGAEPGLQLAPDGTLFAIAWTRLFSDAGGAWRELDTPFDHNGDSDLAIGGDGTMHVVGMRLGSQGAPFLPYWRSRDAGATWDLVSDLHPDGPIDRPWIAVGPDGRLVVAWNDFEAKRTTIVSSRDGGQTWGDPFHIDSAWYPLLSRPVFRGEETFLALHNGGPIIIARQASPGGPWGAWVGVQASVESFFAPLAIDGAGTLHLVSIEEVDGAQQVRHRQSPDGVAWSAPTTVSDGLEAVMPWPVPLRTGVAVAFYQASASVDDRPLPLQLAMPEEAVVEWHAVVAVPEAGGWRKVPTTTGPVHVGPMCTRSSECSDNARPFYDAFEAIPLGGGGIAVVHVVHGEQRGGVHGLVVARS